MKGSPKQIQSARVMDEEKRKLELYAGLYRQMKKLPRKHFELTADDGFSVGHKSITHPIA